MPVFDFSSTPENEKKQDPICTYTTFRSNEGSASAEKPILILEQIPETGQILKHTNNANQSFCSSGCRKTDFLFFPAKTLEKKRTLCYNNNNVM